MLSNVLHSGRLLCFQEKSPMYDNKLHQEVYLPWAVEDRLTSEKGGNGEQIQQIRWMVVPQTSMRLHAP